MRCLAPGANSTLLPGGMVNESILCILAPWSVVIDSCISMRSKSELSSVSMVTADVPVVAADGRLLPARQPTSDFVGRHVSILEWRTLAPLSCGLIADDHAHIMVVGAILNLLDIEAKLSTKPCYVHVGPGQEGPVSTIALRILTQHRRCVDVRINSDRVKKHIMTDAMAEDLSDLNQVRRFQWAGVNARGEDEVNDDYLAFDQIVEKANLLSVLCCQRYVGKMSRIPG